MSGNQQPDDGPLAEFVALRQEIDRRSTMQHNLFALQLTASAVIFSFALSRRGWSGFLLIIPISTFMLSARYVDQMYDIKNAASYIRDELSEKVPGKLGWEKWLDKQEQSQECQSRKEAQFSQRRRRAALIVTFPAIAFGALAWSAPNVFWAANRLSTTEQSALIVTWIVGLAAALSAMYMIWRALNFVRPSGHGLSLGEGDSVGMNRGG